MISPERVCKVLEGITMIEWSHKTIPLSELVYRFCHIARETKCKHPDWEKLFEETETVILRACDSPANKMKNETNT